MDTPQGPSDRPGTVKIIELLGGRLADGREELEVRTACALALGLTGRSDAIPVLRGTGDIGRRDEHGLLQILGRRDFMVKTRGYRVELGDVEATVDSCPGVAEVAVVAVPDDKITHSIHAVVIGAGATDPRELSGRDQQMLQEMAGWVERELAAQQELDRAAQVQQVLMPATAPVVDGYELAGRCVPTQAIGGDFFAWHTLPGGALQLHVADVMGKGIPAALIAASVRAMLVGAAQFNDQAATVHRTATAAEELLSATGAFVTAFSARLDPATGVLDYIDAGHGLAFVFGPHGYRRLHRSGPPIGIFPETTWPLHTTTLAPGELLVVVSDGFLDFFPTLEHTLEAAARAGLAEATAARLVDRAIAYARTRGHPDDVTVLALRREPA